MQAVGIIAEYNPFHNGHQWQARAAKEHSGCQLSIAVMSGHFVQRGQPAMFNKWLRAEMAVNSGIDLVFELPTVFALRSAQYFAAGGIRLLNALGLVSHLCFGAEDNDIEKLKQLAAALDDETAGSYIRTELKSGSTYAAAVGRLLTSHTNAAPNAVNAPNNILGVEYLRALTAFAPTITPIAVKRQHAAYHSTEITTSPFASATAVRQALHSSDGSTQSIDTVVPPRSLQLITTALTAGQAPLHQDILDAMLFARLRTAALTELAELPDIAEGLHYKLAECARQTATWHELTTRLKSKRYTWTRLQRILCHLLLGTTKETIRQADQTGPLYARVLAFNDTGRAALKTLQATSSIPIITKTAHYLSSKTQQQTVLTPLQQMLAVDITASDLYALACPALAHRMGGADYLHSPVYIRSAARQ